MSVTINCDDVNNVWDPYVWFKTGNGATSKMEANTPGAHFVFCFTGTSFTILFDASIYNAVAANFPKLRTYLATEFGWVEKQLLTTDAGVWTVGGLAAGNHVLHVFIKNLGTAGTTRWTQSGTRATLLITGFQVDNGASTWAGYTKFPDNLLWLTDSHGDGTSSDQLCPDAPTAQINDGSISAARFCAMGLGMEVGVVAYGGQGFRQANTLGVPAYHVPGDATKQTAFLYSVGNNRLVGGLFVPAPKIIVVSQGGNDAFNGFSDANVIASLNDNLTMLRAGAPDAWIFPLIPVGRWKRSAHLAATMPDGKCIVLDYGPELVKGFCPVANEGGDATTTWAVNLPSARSHDGAHPTAYAHAQMGAKVAALIRNAMAVGGGGAGRLAMGV